MGGGTQLIIDNVDKPYIEIIDNKIISNDGIEEWDISNDIEYSSDFTYTEMYGWGNNQYGQLGVGYSTLSQVTILRIDNMTKWKQLSVEGGTSTIALSYNNELYGWGNNYDYQLNLQTVIQYTPIKLSDTKWKYTLNKASASFFISEDNVLYGCGDSIYYQLGMGTTKRECTIVKLNDNRWKQVSGSVFSTIAQTTTGEWYGWGENADGQLGIYHTPHVNNRDPHPYPIKLKNTDFWESVIFGYRCTLIKSYDGYWYGCGLNHLGQLGLGHNTAVQYTPVKLSNTKWICMANADYYTCAISEDKKLYVWGSNGSGDLGLGYTSDYQTTPIKLSDTKWKSVSCGSNHTLAITESGELYAWGYNYHGQLGLGYSHNGFIHTPIKIQTVTTWKEVKCGYNYTIAFV